MATLRGGAAKIGAIVTPIDQIAGRTGLPALQATIGAARAGKAGRGLAVVASEAKSPAAPTARATEEIGSQVQSIRSTTLAAVSSIMGSGSNERSDTVMATDAAALTVTPTLRVGRRPRGMAVGPDGWRLHVRAGDDTRRAPVP